MKRLTTSFGVGEIASGLHCVTCVPTCVHLYIHKALCVCVCVGIVELYIHARVCWCTLEHMIKPQMYPPAGGRRGAPAASSQSGRQRETAGRWCWTFGSECGACYGRTTPLPSAVRSHRRRRKLVKGTNEGGVFHKGQSAEKKSEISQ